jgi:hypothetical protein
MVQKSEKISTFHHFQYLDGWRVSFVFWYTYFIQQFAHVRERERERERARDNVMLFTMILSVSSPRMILTKGM